MDRLIATNSVPLSQADTAPNTGTPQYATSGNPAAGIPPTVFPAYAWNMLQDEIRAVIVAAGLTPSGTNWGQLNQAIAILIAVAVAGGGGPYMPLSGGTFTGPVVVENATAANQPVALGQVAGLVPALFGTVENKLGSRAVATTYTNTSSKPMFVSVSGFSSAASTNISLTISGVAQAGMGQQSAGSEFFCCGIVPPGAEYFVSVSAGTLTIQEWVETV